MSSKLTPEQQTILSFHNYMNEDRKLNEDMFLIALDSLEKKPLDILSGEYIRQMADKLNKNMFRNTLYDDFDNVIMDIVKDSATSIQDAVLYMQYSDDYERDSLIVKRMSNKGICTKDILQTIKAINNK